LSLTRLTKNLQNINKLSDGIYKHTLYTHAYDSIRTAFCRQAEWSSYLIHHSSHCVQCRVVGQKVG